MMPLSMRSKDKVEGILAANYLFSFYKVNVQTESGELYLAEQTREDREMIKMACRINFICLNY